MTWSSTLRNVAGNVFEVILFSAFWADIREHRCRKEKAAFATFPIGQATLGTDISNEPIICCVATVSANPFFVLFFHLIFLLSLSDQ